MTPTTLTTPRRVPLSRYYWGLGACLLTLLTGAWLILAPFALGYQAYGAAWTSATKNDFWFGLGIVVVSAAGLALFAGSLVGALRAAGVVQPRPRPQPQPAPPSAGLAAPAAPVTSAPLPGDLERTLATLAAALAADLNERRTPDAQRATDTPPVRRDA